MNTNLASFMPMHRQVMHNISHITFVVWFRTLRRLLGVSPGNLPVIFRSIFLQPVPGSTKTAVTGTESGNSAIPSTAPGWWSFQEEKSSHFFAQIKTSPRSPNNGAVWNCTCVAESSAWDKGFKTSLFKWPGKKKKALVFLGYWISP